MDRMSATSLPTPAAFAAALLDPDHATPSAVAGPKGKTATKRYNVYRNNVTVSLINALADIFPATQRITGVDFFRAMARFHVRATPPTSPLLFDYGREFPDFIERYEYARSMPWLADWRGSSGHGSTPIMPPTRAPGRTGPGGRSDGAAGRRHLDHIPRRGSCAPIFRPSPFAANRSEVRSGGSGWPSRRMRW